LPSSKTHARSIAGRRVPDRMTPGSAVGVRRPDVAHCAQLQRVPKAEADEFPIAFPGDGRARMSGAAGPFEGWL